VKAEVREVLASLDREGYVADPAIATAVFLAQAMQRPLLVEGEAGVGKTELAKVLAKIRGAELIRLQCYEGLDVQTAVYEWNYPRQLLRMRMGELESRPADEMEATIFSREYLLERPLLRALTAERGPPVLLVDEVDRADDAFEAFLLELLSDFQVTVPELGTIRAEHRPQVVLTSNRTRELGDALRRRCLYLYLEHPSFEKEVRIIRRRLPEANERLAREVGRFVSALRGKDLVKPPGVAETLDWTQALLSLQQEALEPEVVAQTLGCLLKDRADFATVTEGEVAALVALAREAAGP
jgi:MoxR-like ATPase